MLRAVALARRGLGAVSPNPPVGCVIARGETVLAEGWHARFGGLHAEAAALEAAGERARGATAYVTLMPCAHHGKTPPCADALLRAGVSRVVVACADPNPLSAGGAERLRAGGVRVETGCRAREAALVMRGFLKHARTGRPLLTLKMAATLDGKTATPSGESAWISSPESRTRVQAMRAASDAVLVGVGTVLRDDPRLTLRPCPPRRGQPLRAILDSFARTPPDARLFREPGGEVLILTTQAAPAGRRAALESAGARVLPVETAEEVGGGASSPRADPAAALRALAEQGAREVLSEGGATVAGALFDAGLIDEIALFVAPKLLGGAGSAPILAGTGIDRMADAVVLHDLAAEPSGPDLLLRARVGDWSWMNE
jgi:diaminohydroxyphosphoribosylaminopyrimidine deaminase/5-amino-6-(5-phosphoribosylamino)uracil reductase